MKRQLFTLCATAVSITTAFILLSGNWLHKFHTIHTNHSAFFWIGSQNSIRNWFQMYYIRETKHKSSPVTRFNDESSRGLYKNMNSTDKRKWYDQTQEFIEKESHRNEFVLKTEKGALINNSNQVKGRLKSEWNSGNDKQHRNTSEIEQVWNKSSFSNSSQKINTEGNMFLNLPPLLSTSTVRSQKDFHKKRKRENDESPHTTTNKTSRMPPLLSKDTVTSRKDFTEKSKHKNYGNSRITTNETSKMPKKFHSKRKHDHDENPRITSNLTSRMPPLLSTATPTSQNDVHLKSKWEDGNSRMTRNLTSVMTSLLLTATVTSQTYFHNDKHHDAGKKRYLIYRCDGSTYCGGWGDRQRGMVSVFLLSMVTNRTFGIIMSSPCALELYYVPNAINWIVKTRQLKGLSSLFLDGMDRNKKNWNLPSWDFNEEFPDDLVYLQTNLDYISTIVKNPLFKRHLPSWVKNGRSHIFKTAWNMLMKYSPHLEENVNNLISQTGGAELICAHIRLKQNPTIPNDSKSINSISSIEHLWKFLDKYTKNSTRVFIATDSVEVRKLSRERFKGKQLDSGGMILHIDRQRKWKNACVGFKMAVLDQAVLTRCKVLVCSMSNFSLRAAMLANIKDLFIFKNGTISKLENLDYI